MNAQQFNKLGLQDQVLFLNSELSKDHTISVTKLCKQLGLVKSTIIDRFSKANYKFDVEQKQYIKNNSVFEDVEYKHNTNTLQLDNSKNPPVPKNNSKHNANIFDDAGNKNKMVDILSKYDDLMKIIDSSIEIQDMLQWYTNQKNIKETTELKINNTNLTGEVKTTTIRIYSDVWNNFREFTESFKVYKSMDLLSMALIEFIDKYKK